MDQWITQAEAATIMRRTRGRVSQLCTRGSLRSRWDKGRRLVLREDADKFAANPPLRGRPRKVQ